MRYSRPLSGASLAMLRITRSPWLRSHFAAKLREPDFPISADVGDPVGNRHDLPRIAHPQFDGPRTVKLAYRNNSVAPSRGDPLQRGIEAANRNRDCLSWNANPWAVCTITGTPASRAASRPTNPALDVCVCTIW